MIASVNSGDQPEEVVTLQQVADLAGVSRPTASLALNGNGRIAEATRQRVRDAAHELDYVVNATARNLRTSRSGLVGIYAPDRALPFRFYMDVAFGAIERGLEGDTLVTLMPSEASLRKRSTEHFDGFLIIDPVADDPMIGLLLRGRRPVVSAETPPSTLPAPWATVYVDHAAGIRMLLDHVTERGGHSPGVMLIDLETSWGRESEAAYHQWCHEHGAVPDQIVRTFGMSTADVRRELGEFIQGRPDLDALIVSGEGTALIALEAIRAAGRVVGSDILLASYLDNDAYTVTTPSITAVDTQPREMGRLLMDRLLAALDDSSQGRGATVEAPMVLIERGSTRGLTARSAPTRHHQQEARADQGGGGQQHGPRFEPGGRQRRPGGRAAAEHQ